MKAVILAAGTGSRLMPLTKECPKCLLKIGRKPILSSMLEAIERSGIQDVVMVLGYLESQIREYVIQNHSTINVEFLRNEKYDSTNTGYSLWLTQHLVKGGGLVKFDADVMFDEEILRRLVKKPGNYLCVDKNINLEAEEVKVETGLNDHVVRVGKGVDPNCAIGESIGIERIDKESVDVLFDILDSLMEKPINHNDYYEKAYERMIEQGVPFKAMDITGLDWVEIDDRKDFEHACRLFT